MTSVATILILSAAQVHNLNLVIQEAPNALALRAEAIFLTESSGGISHRHRDPTSHGWFQLQVKTACLVAGYRDTCPISEKKLETDTTLNLHLGIAYIQYCQNNFPESQDRAIACYRWGVPKTKAMTDDKLKRLQQRGGYVWKVLNYEKQLRAIPVSTD